MTDVTETLGPDERVRDRLSLRTGGSVAVTDDHLYVTTEGDRTRIPLDEIAEVTVEDFDYFLGVLSVLLVGYGIYSIPRATALGLGFAVFGAGSLYWTYRKRGKARVRVTGRSKPISVFPTDPGAFHDALEPLLVSEAEDAPSEKSG